MSNKKIILMTGTPGRLGSAFCEKYYDDYFVIGVARNEKSNFAHEFIKGDITTDAEKIVDHVLEKHKKIDVVVNNAATYSIKPLSELKPDEMLNLFSVNVVAPHALTRFVVNKFWWNRPEKNKLFNRSIVNVSSVSATNVYANQGAYASSKAALNMLSRFMAHEFEQYGLRVNTLSPTSFPRLISCERVADSLRELIEGTQHNTILEVLENKKKVRNPGPAI